MLPALEKIRGSVQDSGPRSEFRTDPMTPESPERREASPRSASIPAGAAIRAALEKVLEEPGPPQPGCPSIPDHVLLRRIGTGAYGDVWLARSALGSLRAVKVVYRDRFDEERPFQREFHGILKYEPISRTHAGLVAILHVGRNDQAGYFYYVMELADPVANAPQVSHQAGAESHVETRRGTSDLRVVGPATPPYSPRTLRTELAGPHRLTPSNAANLTLQLANALEHLHSRGLVHRDIKPSNVIFVGGQPKLADIGLVTAAGDSRSFVGTEGFIPPEGPGSPGADLYGLGKLLYELATGRDRMDFPQLPAGLGQLPDGEALLELNEVTTRACAPDPRQRYSTAAELAADLRLFLAGHSLREARQRERHLIFLRRFALTACLLVLLAALAAWLARREAQQAKSREQESRQRADTESGLRRRAEAAEHAAQQQLYSALVEQARTSVRSGEVGHRTHALEALRRAAGISNSFALRREALRALALPDLRFQRKLSTPPGSTLAQLDPRFERFAFCQRTNPVEVRSTSDNRLLEKLPPSASLPAFFAKWSPDGRFLAVKRSRPDAERTDLEVWEVSAARRILLVRNTPYGAFSFDPQRARFTAALSEGSVETWDLESGASIARLKLDHDPTLIMIAPDGERFAQCFEQQPGWTVSVNLLTNGQELASHHFSDRVQWLEWHPSGAWIATPDLGGSVHLVNSRTGDARALGRHKVQAVLTTFSPDGAYLISGGWERELLCWDMQTLDLAFTINLNSFSAQFRADGCQCAIAVEDGIELHAFELPAYDRQLTEDLGGRLRRAAFSPDGRWLAAPGEDRMGLWDLRANGPGALAPEGADARLYFSGDGHELFASGHVGGYRWQISPSTNASSPPRLNRIPLDQPKGFTSLAVVSNLIAFTTTNGSQVVSFDALPRIGTGLTPTVEGINGISADARWLAVYQPYTSILHVHELPSLRPVAGLTNHSNFSSFEFSPLGDELAVASSKRIEFWSTTTWLRTREITNFMGVLFTPDAAALWLSKDYRTAGLYDATKLEPLLPLPSGMLPLAVSPNGRFLALSVDARRIQVWDIAALHNEFRSLGIDWTP